MKKEIITIRKGLRIEGFINNDLDNVIKKARKKDVGSLSDDGKFMKVADVKGNWNASWKPVETLKQRDKVAQEYGYIGGILLGLKRAGGISQTSELKKKVESKEKENQSEDPVVNIINQVSQALQTPEKKFYALYSMGIRNKKDLAKYSGFEYSKICDKMEHIEDVGWTNEEKEKIRMKMETDRVTREAISAKVTVKKRWQSYQDNIKDIIEGRSRAALAYGTGGLGKTFLMEKAFQSYAVNRESGEIRSMKKLKKEGIEWDDSNVATEPKHDWRQLRAYDAQLKMSSDDYEYIVVSGKSTAAALYGVFSQHNDKIIVFDDSDDVFGDTTSINLLKGFLDTEIKPVTYAVSTKIKDLEGKEIEKTLEFTGRTIFISNLSSERFATRQLQPLTQSRALPSDLTMTKKQALESLRDIKDVLKIKDAYGEEIKVTPEDKDAVLELLRVYAPQIDVGLFNARQFASLVKIKQREEAKGDEDWRVAAAVQLNQFKKEKETDVF